MPFVTEELWDKLYGAPGGLLMLRNWPADGARAEDAAAAAEIDWLIRLIDGVRAARAALNVPAGAKIAMIVNGGSRSEEHTSELQSLMRTSYAVFCLKKQQHTHT